MQVLFLDPIGTFVLDVIAWVMLHLGIGYCSARIPVERFRPEKRFFQSFRWEQGGAVYQKLFHVRAWKNYIPQGSRLYKEAFSLQNLPSLEPAYLERWLRESVRAEFCHWMMIVPGGVFFLWNNEMAGWWMVAYAWLNNFFPIVAQRFNRPRIRRYLDWARQAQPVQLARTAQAAGSELRLHMGPA